MRFEQSIDVAAPAAQVFDVYRDVAHWPDWTASVTSVERLDGSGPLQVGSRARVRQPKLPAATWQVTELVPGRSFTWVATGPGVRTTAGHVVEPTGEASCRVTAWLEQAGALGGLMGRLTKGITDRYIAMELRGLKSRCEATSAG
jgi:uncharacterized membrane protein